MRYLSRFGLLVSLFFLPLPLVAQDSDPPPAPFSKSISFNGLFYLTYEAGEAGGDGFADFLVNRAYVTTEADILPFLSARITLDTAQDLEGQRRGDMEVRLKCRVSVNATVSRR